MLTIDEIVREYMGKLYYFSLRKTSSTADAEDLTQEILTEVTAALAKNNIPDNLNAWIWKIAHNRYSRWADRAHRARQDVSSDEVEIPDNTSVEDGVIAREERTLLRRELALMTADYREILCAYYFRDRSISEIAADTGLPPGTIKRKLYESRQQIKEGMNMSRTYGTRSFNPENIRYHQNWVPSTGPDGRRLIERLIPQNILLEAYDNPSSLEELSLALGITVPYLEDELKPLLEYGLMQKNGNKYRTGIVILSKIAQDELYDIANAIADRMAPVVKASIEELRGKPCGFLSQPFDDFVPVIVEKLCCVDSTVPEDPACTSFLIKHHDGSEWAIMGLEITDKQAPWLEVCGSERFHQVIVLGNRNPNALEIDPADVPVIPSWDALTEYLANSHASELTALFDEFMRQRNRILQEAIPEYLRKTAMFHANIDFRRLVMDRLIADGTIVLHEDMNRSAMGVYRFAE
ncbi:MAG: sigma-70 family RNA polymerase sigma factor [Clostridia bacterium]|nr:sigma-70 family RNA polymerase sigma factor [Clostridia bacterium]